MQKLLSSSGLMLKTYRHPLLSIFLMSSSLSPVSGKRKKEEQLNDPTLADKTRTHTHKPSSESDHGTAEHLSTHKATADFHLRVSAELFSHVIWTVLWCHQLIQKTTWQIVDPRNHLLSPPLLKQTGSRTPSGQNL
ncbi:hypothetical protein OG21DRAFT_960124 [Imleria badia]|nr:hypothetical protein OG21DRAFT_960124 [Imleria badia]